MISFFFDIDGTLLPFGKSVPESAVKALQKVKADGHRIFLATGRSPVEVIPEIYELGFRDGVFSAGGIAIADGREIYNRFMTEVEKKEVFSYCKENNLGMMVQTDRGTYMAPAVFSLWKSLMLEYTGEIAAVSSMVEAETIPSGARICKVLYVARDVSIDRIRNDLAARFDVVSNTLGVPDSTMGEIVIKGISKATGIERIMRYYGEDLSNTVVFGDGANDEEMVSAAAVGIALGQRQSDHVARVRRHRARAHASHKSTQVDTHTAAPVDGNRQRHDAEGQRHSEIPRLDDTPRMCVGHELGDAEGERKGGYAGRDGDGPHVDGRPPGNELEIGCHQDGLRTHEEKGDGVGDKPREHLRRGEKRPREQRDAVFLLDGALDLDKNRKHHNAGGSHGKRR